MHIVLRTLIKNEHFENRSFFFVPWHQERECVPIIIASTVEFNLGAMQKHQELAFSGYLQQVMLRTHP